MVSKDYFLSSEGSTDPFRELQATVNAYSEPFSDDASQHPICRFPARYYWLNQRLSLENYQTIHPKCSQLEESINKTKVDSVSMMFVTGYLGNPASSFGHSFIKLNNQGERLDNRLFDLVVGYGADLPDEENVFLYMYRGLFGKYDAIISDKYFYTQDLVYSSTEFRDIWEYELNLSDEEVQFFRLHVWEILGKEFPYYFLNKNCGNVLSRMLEVVIDADLVKGAEYWFVPVETFHNLAEVPPAGSLVREIKYHPSEQKQVYRQFQQLTDIEQQAVSELIELELTDFSHLNTLTELEKIHVIDFLIAYHKYLLVKDPGNSHYKKFKRKLLIERFNLSPHAAPELMFDELSSPDKSNKPSVWFGNFNYQSEQKNFFSLGFIPYAAQSLGKNNLNGNELAVLEVELGLNKDDVFLNRFGLIRIKSFDRYHLPLESELPFSWQLEAAIENVDSATNKYVGYFSGGIGKTLIHNNTVLSYVMINGGLYTRPDTVLITPEIGARIELGNMNTIIKAQKAFNLKGDSAGYEVDLSALVPIVDDMSFYFGVNYLQQYQISFGIQLYQ